MRTSALLLCLLVPAAQACETSHLPLSGTATVPTCSPQQDPENCIYAGKALYQYMDALPDSDDVLTIGLHASPWRVYDGDMRILTIDELATSSRNSLNGKVKRVELIGSWTGVSPAPGTPSLAQRLSDALGGIPVTGEDGFLWLSKDGSRRATRQAFTLREGGGSYFLPKDQELLVSLAAGWFAQAEDVLPDDDANLQMLAAAGKDIFLLCPDDALVGFEHAAGIGSAIAAYNAAIMRLERGGTGDRTAALALLEQAAVLGDEKSKALLSLEKASK